MGYIFRGTTLGAAPMIGISPVVTQPLPGVQPVTSDVVPMMPAKPILPVAPSVEPVSIEELPVGDVGGGDIGTGPAGAHWEFLTDNPYIVRALDAYGDANAPPRAWAPSRQFDKSYGWLYYTDDPINGLSQWRWRPLPMEKPEIYPAMLPVSDSVPVSPPDAIANGMTSYGTGAVLMDSTGAGVPGYRPGAEVLPTVGVDTAMPKPSGLSPLLIGGLALAALLLLRR